MMTVFRGEIYMAWIEDHLDESTPTGRLVYSRSKDGIHWTPREVLATRQEISTDDSLIILEMGWLTLDDSIHFLVTLDHRQVFKMSSTVGRNWTGPVEFIVMAAFDNPRRLPSGDWIWLGHSFVLIRDAVSEVPEGRLWALYQREIDGTLYRIQDGLFLGDELFVGEADGGFRTHFYVSESSELGVDPVHTLSFSQEAGVTTASRELNESERRAIYGSDGSLQQSDG